MKWGLSILALCALLAATAPEGGAAEQGGGDAKLLKMVVLSRHGVRSPTQSSETLESWSRKDWPEWPVKRGELTPRGAKLVTAMWEQEAAFLREAGYCPQKVARSRDDSRPVPIGISVRGSRERPCSRGWLRGAGSSLS